MNSLISNLILTLFSITVQLHIYFKKAFRAENLDIENAGFYSFIFTPLLVFTGMLFTSLVITMGLFIKSQSKFTRIFLLKTSSNISVNSARRLQASFQSEQSSLRHHSVQFESDEPVNDHYNSQPSSSFTDLAPTAPSEDLGSLYTVEIKQMGPRLTADSC